jgi:4-hydroxy-tetrahydrodipicolinate synthase
MSIFEGSGVAIVTPFDTNGKIDYLSYEKLINFQIQNNTDAIVVCGTTGESSTLTTLEKIQLYKTTVEITNNRIPVIGGSGSNCTQNTIDMCKEVQKSGANGCLVVTPYYNKTTQKGLVAHYTKIANSVDIPIILYNVPSRTGLNITPNTAYELSKIENIVAIKEASSDISQIAAIAELCGDDLHIYSGNDDQIVPILSLGGKGVISVLANIAPKQIHDIVSNYLNGNINESLQLQLKSLGIIKGIFCEVNPIPIKTALNLMGMTVGGFRLPLLEMEYQNKQYLIKEMKRYELITDLTSQQ